MWTRRPPGDFDERYRELSRAERRQLVRAAKRSRRNLLARRIGAAYIFAWALATAAMSVSGWTPGLLAAAPGLWLGLLGVGGSLIGGIPRHHLICDELARRNPAICPHCGYLAEDFDPCPECGRSRADPVRRWLGIWRR